MHVNSKGKRSWLFPSPNAMIMEVMCEPIGCYAVSLTLETGGTPPSSPSARRSLGR